MSMPATLDLEHYRGDTLGILVKCWRDTAHQQPANLTGATVTAQVATRTGVAEVLAEFQTQISVPSGGTVPNQISLILIGDDQRDMPAQVVWDCQIDWADDGTATQTPVKGSIRFTDDVTRTVADDGS